MTIGLLIKGLPTIQQYDILMRADVILAGHTGRYFGGLITEDEVKRLKGL